MTFVRPPAVAGTFYPADAATLTSQIHAFLAGVDDVQPFPGAPKALIVPHAGYVYSGPIAAHAYAHLAPLKDTISRVVLLGPCHRVAVRGLALSSASAFATPLGTVELEHSLDATLLADPNVLVHDATHTAEHSLEVHIPFLQTLLNDFKVLPMVVGDASPEAVDGVLDAVWGGPETLVVVSTDLSHYLDYERAQMLDRQTCRAIENLDFNAIGPAQACGRMALKGLLHLAHRKAMHVRTLDLRNSGDTAGGREQVVGYGSWALWEGQP